MRTNKLKTEKEERIVKNVIQKTRINEKNVKKIM